MCMCTSRTWKSLLRAYKNVKDHNKKSGSGTKSYEYENELNDILGNDPIISPTFTFSSDASMASSAEKKLNESNDSDDTSTSDLMNRHHAVHLHQRTKPGKGEQKDNEMRCRFLKST